jgi:hypothetical protein
MTKIEIPDYLPISPISLRCPFCHAKANKVCETASGGRLELSGTNGWRSKKG